MAEVYTFEERQTLLDEANNIIKQLIALNGDIEEYRNLLIDSESTAYLGYPNIETHVTALLPQLDYLRDQAVAVLNAVTLTYDNECRPTSRRQYTTCDVDADNGSSRGELTADAGDPFAVFDVNDVVEISNAEDSANDGEYTVYSRTDTVLTFTTTMSTDNLADTSITVTLKQR